jgi:hypothetical protein
MKLEFLSTGFRKILKYEISRKSSQWQPSFSMRTDGQADILDESNNRFMQFCEHLERKDDLSELTGKSDKLPGFKNSSLCIISVFPFRKKREANSTEDQFHCIVN